MTDLLLWEAGQSSKSASLGPLQGGPLQSGETLKGKWVVITVDGGRTPLRRRKHGKVLATVGADWRQRSLQLLQKLQVPSERVFELIGFYHAAEHLQTFAEAACFSKKKAKTLETSSPDLGDKRLKPFMQVAYPCKYLALIAAIPSFHR